MHWRKRKMKYGKQIMRLGMIGVVGMGAASAMGGLDHETMQSSTIQDALEANDYDAFISAVAEKDPDAAERISEERFEKIVERFDIKNEISDALEVGDYDAWVQAVAQTPYGENIQEIITEDNFDELVEFHEARVAGDKETAKELAEELGLPSPHEQRQKKMAFVSDVKDALESEDYAAWVEAVEQSPRADKITEVITEDNFDDLVALHEAREAGESELAKEIAEELGLPLPGEKIREKLQFRGPFGR
jgi:hypothetical protein